MQYNKRFQTLIVTIIFIVILMPNSPIKAQEDGLIETFDNVELPGWEFSEGAQVSDGSLVLEKDMYALHGGQWMDKLITIDFLWEGSGAVIIHYQVNDAGSYLVRINDSGVSMLMDRQGKTQDYGSTTDLVSKRAWHNLKIASSSGIHSILLDDKMIMEGIPPENLSPGGILLSVEGPSFASFSQIIVGSDHPQPQPDEELSSPLPSEQESPTSSGSTQSSELSWVRLGGPPGGLGYDIRYNFNHPDIWYVTDQNAGVHISTDDGLTWKQSNTGIQRSGGAAGDGVPIFCLTVDPHDPDIIWSATAGNGQIYKSIDGGKTWTLKDKGVIRENNISITFRGITVDPRSSNIVYVMGELIRQGYTGPDSITGGVVYRSTDGGENWTRIWNGNPPSSLTRYLWVNPENPDILYVSTGIFDAGAVGEGDPETNPEPFGGLGILKSIDGGKTWHVLGEENGLKFRYLGSLFMHPDNPDILLAAAGRLFPELAGQYVNEQEYSPVGIYRTSNGGEFWKQVLIPEVDVLTQAFGSVEICPGDHNIVYAGSEFAVYRSDDGGLTWKRTTGGPQGWGPPGVLAGVPIDMQCDPRDANRVFSNNYSGGNFLSEDGGKTWQNASSGYSGAQVINVSVDPSDPARVYAAGRSGVWVSEDAGTTWKGMANPGDTKAVAGGECSAVAVDPEDSGHILLSCLSGLMEKKPEEDHWTRQIHPPGIHPGISEMEFGPSDPKVVYATSASHNSMVHADNYEDGRGIIVSITGGSTWKVVTGELFKDSILTDVAVDPLDPKVVYVAAQNGLFKSKDTGSSWSAPSTLLNGKPVRSVAVDPADAFHLLAGVQYMGLFKSNDGGVSWHQVTAGLEPNAIPRDIVFDPTNTDIVYLGDILSGVYQSRDGGESWQKFSTGITNRAITTLSISSDGNHLYAGTGGGGVFRLDLNGVPPVVSSETAETTAPAATATATQIPPGNEPVPSQPANKPILPCPAASLGLPVLILLISSSRFLKRKRD